MSEQSNQNETTRSKVYTITPNSLVDTITFLQPHIWVSKSEKVSYTTNFEPTLEGVI